MGFFILGLGNREIWLLILGLTARVAGVAGLVILFYHLDTVISVFSVKVLYNILMGLFVFGLTFVSEKYLLRFGESNLIIQFFMPMLRSIQREQGDYVFFGKGTEYQRCIV